MRDRKLLSRWLPIILGIVVILLVLGHQGTAARLRESLASLTVRPLTSLRALGRALERTKNMLVRPASGDDLLALEERLVIDKAELLKLRQENEELTRALGFRMPSGENTLLSKVIGGFAEGRDEYLVLRQDERSSIPEGAAVMSPAGILLGVVRTVSAHSATARLLSSPSEVETVAILPSGVKAIMRGDNSGEYLITLVPEHAEVAVGDIVTTAGHVGLIPSDIPVGAVVAVEHRSGEAFLEVRAKAPFDVSLLDQVLVVFQ